MGGGAATTEGGVAPLGALTPGEDAVSVREVDAILLRSWPWSESSRILRFVTPDAGVIGVVARGVRRTGARGAGGPSTFDRGRLSFDFRPDRDLHPYRDFHIQRSAHGLGRSTLRFAGASFLGELMDRIGEADEDGFVCFDRALVALNEEREESLPTWAIGTGWRLVGLAGYAPDLSACLACGRALEPAGEVRFLKDRGGVECPECQRPDRGLRLGPASRHTLTAFLEGRIEGILPRADVHLRLLHDYLLWHLGGVGRPLESAPILLDRLERLARGAGGSAG